jgi:hypothetical protein
MRREALVSVNKEERGDAQQHAYLLPPPRLLQHGELAPVIEPALRGVPAFDGPPPDHLEPFESEEASPAVSAELLERARETVLAHGGVREHLDGERFEWIGVSARDEKALEDGDEAPLLAILYSYDRNRAIEVRLDASGEKVHDVSIEAYQPPATDEEVRRAVELARSHPRLAESVTEDLVGTAILMDAANAVGRRFDVRFGCPSERLPRFMATVDLSREAVVSVGSCCGHDLGHAVVDEGVQP